MKIALDDIKATPKELAYTEGVDELNARLDRGVHDYRVPRGLEVRVEFYRSGLDVFFNGAARPGDRHLRALPRGVRLRPRPPLRLRARAARRGTERVGTPLGRGSGAQLLRGGPDR